MPFPVLLPASGEQSMKNGAWQERSGVKIESKIDMSEKSAESNLLFSRF